MLSKKSQLKNSNQNRNEKGITLVALVITVVVMLILAGVAIAAVIDGDGLFSRARESAQTYENAAREEGDTIQSMINQIDGYIDEINNPNNPVVKDIATIGTIVTENQTYDGRLKGTYSNPIIPKGFAPINENGAIWGTTEGYKSGLVITDEVDESGNSIGNEFVWVPVDGIAVKFERIEWGTESLELTECSETVPQAITTSVNNNGGFYIARYEAGIATNMPQEELTSNSSATYGSGAYKPVSKKEAIVWNRIQWGDANDDTAPGNGAVTVARSMYPNGSDSGYGVVSTLIYGVQWDTALKFIGAYDVREAGYDTYATNSTGMGNYSGISGADDIPSTSTPAECGAREGFRQKNIYDMAGNVDEWTMEKHSTNRVFRGGTCSGSALTGPASGRGSIDVDKNYTVKRFPCSTLYKVDLNTEGHRIN